MNWIIFRFSLIGPAAGTFAFVAADQLLDGAGVATSSLATPGSLAAIPFLSLYGLVLAYPVGGMPAAICGVIYAIFLRYQTRRNPVPLMRFLIGGLLGSCVAALLFSGFWLSSQHGAIYIEFLRWGAAGLLGGGVSALAVNNSLYFGFHHSGSEKHAT